MTETKSPKPQAAKHGTPQYGTEAERQAASRAARRAEQLRANLQRRKSQTRARRDGGADETDGLPAARDEGGKVD
ncbi:MULTISPECIES: hypothetical protein [Hoeflea]|uniref:DUF4169 domain-containing protein n=1 Tax=Hoeflea algicola TaxID=2983763 RepID=A0ABT3ZDF7_9HYPH|nr:MULTISPECIES: hypothetical protein [Hoeflea]MCY0149832.1 hypothetical protein [Hoeflea algicola]